MVIFNSYVKLPEGMIHNQKNEQILLLPGHFSISPYISIYLLAPDQTSST